MEQNSQVSEEEQINILDAQIRECFGRVVWSHKTHEKCANIVLQRHHYLKLFLIILSAITTTSLLLAIFGDSKAGTIVGAVFSTILFALTSYSKDYDLGELAQKHINSANKLWDIRETYLSLLTDIKIRKVLPKEIMQKRDMLQKLLLETYVSSPRTNSKAYKEASEALKELEEYTFNDGEIDAFLPKELRKGSSK